MALNNERQELHKRIWQIANELRGSVTGWDFKQFVLGFLFYRFISEYITEYINSREKIDYPALSDNQAQNAKTQIVKEKGFFIAPSELFVNVLQAANPEDINEKLSTVFANIENSAKGTDAEDDFKGLFDDIDVNSARLGNGVIQRNEKLIKIMQAIGSLELGRFEDNNIDAFGDAYEYLMTMYAANAGKSGGEFFTPQEVSEVLAKITTVGKAQVNKVYDPACGSGSLLLKFNKVLGKDKVLQGFFGQEIELTTYNLCRINMFLHGVPFNKFSIAHGDTLKDPKHDSDEPFDAIVSNPPYSIHWEGDANPVLINDPRFSPAGVLAPKSKADLAFTMHILSWLSESGTAAIVEFPGVLYRGGAEQKIRKYLIQNNFVDAVIQLPPDLFFGTSIATCIIVLKKSAKTTNDILFIDASQEFSHVGNKNKLTPENQDQILNSYIAREDKNYFSKVVSISEVLKNDCNLSVSTYVEKEDTREVIDIVKLEAQLKEIVARENELRAEIDKIVAGL